MNRPIWPGAAYVLHLHSHAQAPWMALGAGLLKQDLSFRSGQPSWDPQLRVKSLSIKGCPIVSYPER